MCLSLYICVRVNRGLCRNRQDVFTDLSCFLRKFSVTDCVQMLLTGLTVAHEKNRYIARFHYEISQRTKRLDRTQQYSLDDCQKEEI